MGNTRVSIQGYEGSFHQVAARQFFGDDVEVITCATFREVVRVALDRTLFKGVGTANAKAPHIVTRQLSGRCDPRGEGP